MAPEFHFSGVLVHQLLLRKLRTKIDDDDEVCFKLGPKSCRFSVGECALMTGSNFGVGLSEAELEERLQRDKLLNMYFNEAQKVKLSQLQTAFLACIDVEDMYKLGLLFG